MDNNLSLNEFLVLVYFDNSFNNTFEVAWEYLEKSIETKEMTEKTYYHTPTTLMERIKYKMDVPYVCNEDAINDDDEYFFQEESEERSLGKAA